MGGALVIKGTRVPASRIIYLLSKGITLEEITKSYFPFLTVAQIKKALKEAGKIIE